MSLTESKSQSASPVRSPYQAFTASALRERLLPATAPGGVLAWLIPLVITLLGGLLRFVHLNHPHELIFDETYYVKDAWALLHFGHEMEWVDESNDRFIAGDPQLEGGASYVVHPPLGKWLIGLGMLVFGEYNGLGWRTATALFGTLAVLLVTLCARALFNSHALAGIAGLLLAVDGHSIVMSRTALLDVFLMFFILAGFYALVLDRADGRRRLIAKLSIPPGNRADYWMLRHGPMIWFRPWRLVAGLMLGCAVGVKWSALSFVAVFGILTVLWDLSARRTAGIRHWVVSGLWRDGILAFFQIIPLVLATYLATWSGWLAGSEGRYRNWAAEHPGEGLGWLPAPLRSLWQYHVSAYSFHTGLDSPHSWQSPPWTWMFAGRPVLFYFEGYDEAVNGCTVSRCTEVITDLPNPVMWWAAALSMVLLILWWIGARDWRAGAILSSVAAGFLPWLLYPERTMFFFYTLPMTPFLMLALTFMIGKFLPPGGAASPRYPARLVLVVLFLAVLLVVSAFFWPIWSGQMIPDTAWRARVWIPSWS
ncbi:phospholipid carrier-dependent glycosyltransferase [Glutamicibacter sp. V16R2B1]|uniref:dolichyl-phosphate-mannose--protein mannosyltransferase n=1 Tax=Glutamicibacter sp. V16R2B1 TaxID=2036207 RepID=UPI0010FDEEF9|nr:phospholipid carrier-dependent glycosyltransferase [Glutamicibacter sp. V16R2B1]TLK53616.1 phospholipid carrier-dependent glycosyltransferase [Glutamicibacter sp. V16R2B1]